MRLETIRRFMSEEDGLEKVESALMTALIVTAVVMAIWILVTAITGRFDEVSKVSNSL